MENIRPFGDTHAVVSVDAMALLRLGNMHAAIIDADIKSAQMTRSVISSLGITSVSIFRTPQEAWPVLQERFMDIVIVDAQLKNISGLDFVRQVRRDPASKNRTVPIILTCRDAGLSSIASARDAGVNEYLAKPFSPKSMRMRLDSLIDEPRSFIVAKDYIGPDRRRDEGVPAGMSERRNRSGEPAIKISRDQWFGAVDTRRPIEITPDFELKQKLESNTRLAGIESLIQKEEIASLGESFVSIAKAEVSAIRNTLKQLQTTPEFALTYCKLISDAAASIALRSKNYDYQLAAKVAEQLREFCTLHYDKRNRAHTVVIEKHIETLSSIFTYRLSGDGGVRGEELFNELAQLVHKYI